MLYSEPRMQLELHKKLRIKIPEWENKGYLNACGAELTYHPSAKRSYLQAILDLPNVRIPSERRCELSKEMIEQIPNEITDYIKSICNENQIERPRDHEVEMDKARREAGANGKKYYEGLRNDELLRICSIGTKIALEILSMLEADRSRFKDDPDLRQYIDEQIREKLRSELLIDKRSIDLAWHETCNTLGIWGDYSYWKRGFLHEEHTFMRSVSDDGLKLIKARSLDFRMVLTDWKGRLLNGS